MIEISHLTKRYGEHLAVSDLSFTVDSGQIYGFLGPNGAGKSTTMNIMTGCLSATEGSVRIDGHDIFEEPNQAKKLIGYLPEQPPLYMNETPEEYLRFVGEAKGLRGGELERQIDEVISQTGIKEVAHRRISALSKGYKQRVGIAQALLGNPKVIILDEPTVGLDPIQLIEIRDLIKELGQTHTVIFSSHILSEVQTICDQIIMIAKGKLVAFDTPENLEKHLLSPNEVVLTSDDSAAEIRVLLEGVDHITDLTLEETGTGLVTARIKTDLSNVYDLSRTVFFAFATAGKALLELTVKKANLEDIFLELAETDDGASEPPAVEAEIVDSEVAEE
ncbi:ABC transporter ATP-binding protein [Pseudoflavonifractor sp. 524-17]|uniref:ABC transporter ATP-binding protein n=1 Tax=Pseudoflavonifractor sp. 524-17 TaxID=2304577 RepID=UPI00137AD226|nr:ABC transporter ATP-binding protein [Pseudoflavonifractor sp. 524-17]NCE66403.1 ABC transporter ATP-binding protein [Pseudoflavonifractor sp. 524-17]